MRGPGRSHSWIIKSAPSMRIATGVIVLHLRGHGMTLTRYPRLAREAPSCLYSSLPIASRKADETKRSMGMGQSDYTDKTTATAAVLSICESLIALSDRKIIGKSEALAVLEDAAATHAMRSPYRRIQTSTVPSLR
jgi:hypothetical protein